MPLDMVTAAVEEVDVSMTKDASEDMEEDEYKVEEGAYKEVVEESVAHMKM